MSKEAKVGYKKNIGTILLLSFAGSIIYGLPYFRSYYYDTYQAMYHLTNTYHSNMIENMAIHK